MQEETVPTLDRAFGQQAGADMEDGKRYGKGAGSLTYIPIVRSHEAYLAGSYNGLRALRLLRYQLELVYHSAELGKRADVHLPHRPAAMDLYRGLGDAHITRYLLAKPTSRDLNHNLAFSWT